MTDAPSPFRRFLHAAVAGIEGGIDRIDDLLAKGEGHGDKVRLLAYAGYRNEDLVRMKGRVVRYEEPLATGKGLVPRLRAMIDIYNSQELAGITVRFEFAGQTVEAISDDEGYFDIEMKLGLPLPVTTSWEQASLSTPGRQAQQAQIPVPILAPGTDRHWGIISDIDDTVVETGATDFLRNWRRVLIERPNDRLAVPGAATLYKMIAQDHVAPIRPFFYVSSSPWNLYGFIAEFMELNGIPHGPMFLKDYGIDRTKLFTAGHDTHKLAAIETILAFYPRLRFLLIGDNGQRDVEIYAKAVEDFGSRIAGVFIRDVSGTCAAGEKAELLRRIEAAGVPTYCGAGFEEAVAIVKGMDLDRPLEVAKAVAQVAATP